MRADFFFGNDVARRRLFRCSRHVDGFPANRPWQRGSVNSGSGSTCSSPSEDNETQEPNASSDGKKRFEQRIAKLFELGACPDLHLTGAASRDYLELGELEL